MPVSAHIAELLTLWTIATAEDRSHVAALVDIRTRILERLEELGISVP